MMFKCTILVVLAVFATANCFSMKHHKGHKAKHVHDAPLVLVEVFYETLCPYSIAFVLNQLYPTVQQVNQIVNISLVPYGKATEKQDGDNWVFTCQHGPRECTGNVIETCAINMLPEVAGGPTVPTIIELVHCMESATDPSTAGPSCAKTLGIDFAPISACANGQQGNQLEHVMAQRTGALNPQLDRVPWIVVNGVHTDHIQALAISDLLYLVCTTYTGTKPTACN